MFSGDNMWLGEYFRMSVYSVQPLISKIPERIKPKKQSDGGINEKEQVQITQGPQLFNEANKYNTGYSI